MIDNFDFDRELWKLGEDNPAIRETIAKALTPQPGYYSIPTKTPSPTGELEDIVDFVNRVATEEEYQEHQELIEDCKHILEKAQSVTVKTLADALNRLQAVFTILEEDGATLTPREETLKTLDITLLSFIVLYLANTENWKPEEDTGEAPAGDTSQEELEEVAEKILE